MSYVVVEQYVKDGRIAGVMGPYEAKADANAVTERLNKEEAEFERPLFKYVVKQLVLELAGTEIR